MDSLLLITCFLINFVSKKTLPHNNAAGSSLLSPNEPLNSATVFSIEMSMQTMTDSEIAVQFRDSVVIKTVETVEMDVPFRVPCLANLLW